MAASKAESAEKFKMPSEPCPLPSLGSDEESFVVLGKSLSPYEYEVSSEGMYEPIEPIGTTVVEEAKQLINKELSAIEQMSLNVKINDKSNEVKTVNNADANPVKSEESMSLKFLSTLQMEKSTNLPEMPQVNKGLDTSNAISIASFSTDLMPEEMQRKISQIIEENIHLKDTILQNNMSLKSQYERIVVWQEDVQKVHQAHKDKIIEAKGFIERLKKDIFILNQDLEKLREIKNMQDQELATLKNALGEKICKEKLVKTTDDNIKEFELDIAHKKIKELELGLQTLTLENANFKDDKQKLQSDVEKIAEYEKLIEALKGELDSSKSQVEELKIEIMNVKSSAAEKEKYFTDMVNNLQHHIANLKSVDQTEELANARSQLASTQITLTQVEHSRAAAYAQLLASNHKIGELNQRIVDMENQSHNMDEIYALQTQLEVYKADFEAEKHSKEVIKEENDKLLEDLQNLQRRNQQLQEEIEVARDHRDYVVYPTNRIDRPDRNRSANSSHSVSSAEDHSMKCPKCGFGFSTLQALENHVYRCIELDDHLP